MKRDQSVLRIGCSSFINPPHPAWHVLRQTFDVSFLAYGDLNAIVDADSFDEPLVYVQFLDDMIFDPEGSLFVKMQSDLTALLRLIELRCEKSQAPFIFGFSCAVLHDVIRCAKRGSARKQISAWFLTQLVSIASQVPAFYCLDLDACFSDKGFAQCFDQRNWYCAHTRLSVLGYQVLSDAINLICKRHIQAAHKVLVLDCDNTLWGGVIGEEGVAGVLLGTDGVGRAFVDFQKMILRLKAEGTILVLASKNNEVDVWEMFDTHPEMVLSRDDIVVAKINWIDKSKNIAHMAKALDLDVSSFVFWDDNPLEREKAKALLPTMYTVDVPQQVSAWPSHIATLFELSRFESTAEDRNKTAQYAARYAFLQAQAVSVDEGVFIKGIELQGHLAPLSSGNIARATQLCQKTNQFNLTTCRHSNEDLQAFALVHHQYCSIASLKDRFGDHGLVGLFALRPLNEYDLYIDTFLLSCRVLGRQFEFWLMSQIIKIADEHGFSRLIAQFIDSGKNQVASAFLEQCDFTQCDSEALGRVHTLIRGEGKQYFYARDVSFLHNFDEAIYEH